MRAHWLPIALAVGCGDDADVGGRQDAAPRDAASDTATRDAEPRDAEPSTTDAGTCGTRELINQGTTSRFRTTLEQLCAMLERHGTLRCPASRAEYAQSVHCENGGGFPALRRHCNWDVAPAGRWIFERDSGVLLSARVSASLDCGEGFYHSGDLAEWPRCDGQIDEECGICEGGSERDARCPADVLSAHPSTSCTAMPNASCTCGDVLPTPGSACEAGCEDCTAGTCWLSCVCAVDGMYRWKQTCTD
jgi:hypothetical protein